MGGWFPERDVGVLHDEHELKLGGTDVYTPASAYQLVESLRIDYGHLGPFGVHP